MFPTLAVVRGTRVILTHNNNAPLHEPRIASRQPLVQKSSNTPKMQRGRSLPNTPCDACRHPSAQSTHGKSIPSISVVKFFVARAARYCNMESTQSQAIVRHGEPRIDLARQRSTARRRDTHSHNRTLCPLHRSARTSCGYHQLLAWLLAPTSLQWVTLAI